MSYQKHLIDLQNDVDLLEENFDKLEAVTAALFLALRVQPCGCRMKGGPGWHLRAKAEVESECSKHIALAIYENYLKTSRKKNLKEAGISLPSPEDIRFQSR